MDLAEAIKGRRTIRRFQAKPVPQEVLKKVLNAAAMAPSILNEQPWLFTVVTGKARGELMKVLSRSVGIIEDILAPFHLEKQREQEIKEEAMSFYGNLGNAPVVIIVSMPMEDSSFLRKMYLESVAMAIQNLMLAAHGEGLGTCSIVVYSWIERDVKKLIKAEDREIVLFLALGYPAETPKMPPRKTNIVQWLGFES